MDSLSHNLKDLALPLCSYQANHGNFLDLNGSDLTPIWFACLLDPLLHQLERSLPDSLVNAFADDLLVGDPDPLVALEMVRCVRHFVGFCCTAAY